MEEIACLSPTIKNGRVIFKYVIIAPNQRKSITYQISYFYRDYKLTTDHFEEIVLYSGVYETTYPMKIPEKADEGEYTIKCTISNGKETETKEKKFIISSIQDSES